MASPPCVLTLRDKAPSYLHRDHITARYIHGGCYILISICPFCYVLPLFTGGRMCEVQVVPTLLRHHAHFFNGPMRLPMYGRRFLHLSS